MKVSQTGSWPGSSRGSAFLPVGPLPYAWNAGGSDVFLHALPRDGGLCICAPASWPGHQALCQAEASSSLQTMMDNLESSAQALASCQVTKAQRVATSYPVLKRWASPRRVFNFETSCLNDTEKPLCHAGYVNEHGSAASPICVLARGKDAGCLPMQQSGPWRKRLPAC